MYCQKCGTKLEDNQRFCPNCGEACSVEDKIQDFASDVLESTEKNLGSAVKEVKVTIDNGGAYVPGTRLTDDRSILTVILLSIITCRIYDFYFIYKVAQDTNVACANDGEKTSGLVKYILLSIITCGIYNLYWKYKLGNRLANNASRYGMTFQENGTTVLLWDLLGIWVCGLGYFFSLNIIINNTNKICHAYNVKHGM